MIPELSLYSTDGRTVRVKMGEVELSSSEAHDLAFNLVSMSGAADNAPDHHQYHVDLRASCPLCVFEANGQTDRLTNDDEEEGS